jgi:hypothetical protein
MTSPDESANYSVLFMDSNEAHVTGIHDLLHSSKKKDSKPLLVMHLSMCVITINTSSSFACTVYDDGLVCGTSNDQVNAFIS